MHNKVWIWISAVLAVGCVGLLVWALSLRSDLDDSQQQVTELQARTEQAAQSGGDVRTALKGAYESLTSQLGATQADVAGLQADIEQAKTAVTQAQEDARSAAETASADVQARLDEAEANAEVARGQASIAADCGKAYLSAIGSLLDGDSIRDQIATVREQLQAISADCREALEGA